MCVHLRVCNSEKEGGTYVQVLIVGISALSKMLRSGFLATHSPPQTMSSLPLNPPSLYKPLSIHTQTSSIQLATHLRSKSVPVQSPVNQLPNEVPL